MNAPLAAVLIACIVGFLGLSLIVSTQTGSVQNCARSCNGQMASYTETRLDGGMAITIVPLCVCK